MHDTQPDLYDPTSRSASSWASRLAAFKSRGIPDSDPRVVECHAALSFWRLKRTVDHEVQTGLLSPSFAAAIMAKLLEYPDPTDVRGAVVS